MWPKPQFSADLVTFTEEILNGKLHFLCSVICYSYLVIQNSANGKEQTTDGKFPSDDVTHGINSRFICCINDMFI